MKNNNDITGSVNMKKEISLRMESDLWDLTIAHKIMEAKSSRSEKTMNLWSSASLATAAMAFLIFMGSIYTVMINRAPYGTTGSIYSYAYIRNDNNLDNDTIAAKLELTINEAYPMR